MAQIGIDLTVEQIADIITDLNEFERKELQHILSLRFKDEYKMNNEEMKKDIFKVLSTNKMFSISSLF